jgi:fumarate hydratase class I
MMLDTVIQNTELARQESTPLCQDTGTLTFYWRVPAGTDTAPLQLAAEEAVRQATENGWLRKNTIESVSGTSIDINVAQGTPGCFFNQEQRSDLEVRLLQKGGGCENMSCQFTLPDSELGAGRDLKGVRICLLKAVHNAQGFGCSPGVLGVCIGSDRAGSYKVAKEQLMRSLDDSSSKPELAALENQVLDEANQLGIGPMGMGGKTTLLGVKIGERARLPASYFVSVAYMCWACRRGGVRIAIDQSVTWL